MTLQPEQFKRIESLFEEAIQLSPSKRDAYLDEQCKGDATLREQVRVLLEEDAQHNLSAPTVAMFGGIGSSSSHVLSPPMPDRIANYRIVRECGQGGMGTVYEAMQDYPERRVALKMIRSSRGRPSPPRIFPARNNARRSAARSRTKEASSSPPPST